MTISRRRIFATLAKTLCVGVVLAFGVPGGETSAQTKIRVGKTTGASGFHIPAYIAMERGMFAKEGLDAKFVALTGKALVTAGIGGNVDFVPIPGGGSQASLKGADLRYVVGQSLISQWAIVTNPDVRTVKDLKGKILGYGRAGSADYDEGEITLAEFFGMEVGRDYKVISFQGEPERLAALINGSIQGALLSFPNAAKAQVNGFKILVRTGEYLPRVGGTFWVMKDYLEKNKPTVVRFIRAIANASQYLRENKDGSVEVIQKYFAIDKKKEAEFIWANVNDKYGPDIPEGLFRKLFEGRHKRMINRGLWPKDKPLPDIEQFVARDVLEPTLRSMGYYLQRPPAVQGKLN